MPEPENSSAEASAKPFESALGSGRERFLAQLIVNALEDGWCSPEDFLRHFPPSDIVVSLAEADELRAELLVRAAGVHERLAFKKSVTSGSEDLTIALAEGICDEASILEVYQPDDRVRCLDHKKLWAFATEGDLWTRSSDDPDHATGVARMTFILERALAQELTTPQGIVDALTFEQIANCLPEGELRKLVTHALTIAGDWLPLSGENLLKALPLSSLLGYIPLEHTWNNLVLAKVAVPNGFVEREGESDRPPPPEEAEAEPEEAEEEEKKEKKPKKPKKKARKKAAPAPPPAEAPDVELEVTESEDDLDIPFDEPEIAPEEPPEAAAPPDSAALAEAAEALRAIGRLPPSYQKLSIPILRSIESMYADLAATPSDAEREQVIRESFPNEAHLRKAMLALIELLDSSIDTSEPLIREADVDALIKIVLFEERRREESRGDAPASRRASRPAPPPVGRSNRPPPSGGRRA